MIYQRFALPFIIWRLSCMRCYWVGVSRCFLSLCLCVLVLSSSASLLVFLSSPSFWKIHIFPERMNTCSTHYIVFIINLLCLQVQPSHFPLSCIHNISFKDKYSNPKQQKKTGKINTSKKIILRFFWKPRAISGKCSIFADDSSLFLYVPKSSIYKNQNKIATPARYHGKRIEPISLHLYSCFPLCVDSYTSHYWPVFHSNSFICIIKGFFGSLHCSITSGGILIAFSVHFIIAFSFSHLWWAYCYCFRLWAIFSMGISVKYLA